MNIFYLDQDPKVCAYYHCDRHVHKMVSEYSQILSTSYRVLFGEPIDSDKDGLDDVREKELGTGANKPDTDNDGLIDGDEVIIWKTNPLNPDTDGDGFPDGTEVKNGYNPLGIGKIFSATEGNTSTVVNNEK